MAIALHNFPEGLAVGVSFGSENTSDGIITALGIGLQNMPEGLIVEDIGCGMPYGLAF